MAETNQTFENLARRLIKDLTKEAGGRDRVGGWIDAVTGRFYSGATLRKWELGEAKVPAQGLEDILATAAVKIQSADAKNLADGLRSIRRAFNAGCQPAVSVL